MTIVAILTTVITIPLLLAPGVSLQVVLLAKTFHAVQYHGEFSQFDDRFIVKFLFSTLAPDHHNQTNLKHNFLQSLSLDEPICHTV